jgi:beta-xylosidase
MDALGEFDVTVTFCFTPEHRGIAPHHTSAPICNEEFADFCAGMIDRYSDQVRIPGPPERPRRGIGITEPSCAP